MSRLSSRFRLQLVGSLVLALGVLLPWPGTPALAQTGCLTGTYLAQYYDGTTLGGAPVVTRCEASINYDWGYGAPVTGVSADSFSARWVGQFELAAGDYTFSVTGDDGIRLYVDGALVIDGWRDQPPTTYTAVRTLSQGLHEVKVEHYESGGVAVAKVGWQVANSPVPATPTVTEPSTDGQVVHPADVHMETSPFVDPGGDGHLCTDWEIRLAASGALVWQSPCNTVELLHVHLGDGAFVSPFSALSYDTDYTLRARHRDNSGDPATDWSGWGQRAFRTATAPAPGTAVAWTVRQPGYQVEVVSTGFQLPVNIAFVPNPGAQPTDPYYYVTELYGTIKVVSRDGTASDFIRGVLNYRPSGIFPGSGEQGLTGIVVDPASGDVFASMLYEAANGQTYPKVVRFRSNDSGRLAGNATTILDMVGESQGASHQISNLSIKDGKLYVHMGDGFVTATAQNLDSYRGKILRLNLDGSPAADNPFYNAGDGINARDYVFAYGFRNPFGGAWRAADGSLYEVENGPSVDRFAKVVAGRNYLWDGSDASMRNYALHNWSPSVAPVNLAFAQPETFAAGGFPAAALGHAYVSESGPTYATGPVSNGKRVSEFVLDASGNRVAGPTPLVEYTGTGKATAAGLAFGPDGLYFTELYRDDGTAATDVGARVLRVRYVGASNTPPSVSITSPADGATFTAPASITINASAGDTDGTVSKVEFFQGATKLGEDTSAPYSFTWGAVAAGTYTLTAKATDSGGATATSSPVTVTVSAGAPSGDFSLAASPASRNVKRGGLETYTVTVTPSGGFAGAVGWSVSGLPTGASASFSPNPLSVSGTSSSQLTITTSSSTSTGRFTLTITGTSGTLQRTTTVTLNVRR